jgi:hypothetical protein
MLIFQPFEEFLFLFVPTFLIALARDHEFEHFIGITPGAGVGQ